MVYDERDERDEIKRQIQFLQMLLGEIIGLSCQVLNKNLLFRQQEVLIQQGLRYGVGAEYLFHAKLIIL